MDGDGMMKYNASEGDDHEEVMVFSKRLTKTDVNYRLSIPTEAFERHFPPIIHGNTVNINVRYGNGSSSEQWTLPCYIRGGANYNKPVLSGQWHKIASSKGFSQGDTLTFFLIQRPLASRRTFRFEVHTK